MGPTDLRFFEKVEGLVYYMTCFVVLKKMQLVEIAKKNSEGPFFNFFI